MNRPAIKRFFIAINFLMVALSTSIVEGNDGGSGAGLLYQMKFGVLAHDVGDLWSGFSREEGVDLNIEAVFTPSVTIFGGAIRPALGGTINTAGDTSKGYLDLLWQYNFTTGFFLVTGVGAAIHDGKRRATTTTKKALGSRVLFHIPLELGYFISPRTTFSVYFDHISNAYTAHENEGMDTLGVRFGYIF